MVNLKYIFLGAILVGIGLWGIQNIRQSPYGAPPYGEDETSVPESFTPIDRFANWKRPDGPIRVGLQAGHWKNNELPDELEQIRGNGGTTSSSGITEWEVNLKIAEETAKLLKLEHIVVDILPATIPKEYWADAFVSIHADGSLNRKVTGYKVASPWRDRTGKASLLVSMIEKSYEEATKLRQDPNITRNMRGYYAFAWWRYEHAIHPMTPAAILETGFLTNPSDARMLIGSPEIPAKALAEALIEFLPRNTTSNINE